MILFSFKVIKANLFLDYIKKIDLFANETFYLKRFYHQSMKFILKNIVVLFSLLLSSAVFASGPTPPSPPQGTPPPDIPVDQYVVVLIAMALVFAFYSFRKKIYTK